MGKLIDELKAKVEKDETNVDLRLDFGMALAEEHCYEEAARQFEKAIELTPQRADSHYNIGVLFGKFLLDDIAANEMWEDHTDEEAYFARASTAYREAFRLDPTMTAAINNLARLCDAMGMHDEARKYYEDSLKIDSKQPDVKDDLATLLERDDTPAYVDTPDSKFFDETDGVNEEDDKESDQGK